MILALKEIFRIMWNSVLFHVSSVGCADVHLIFEKRGQGREGGSSKSMNRRNRDREAPGWNCCIENVNNII
jgi:hypothetical protein